MYACVPLCVGAPVGQKRVLDPLDLELQVVVSHLMWGLRTEPSFSAGAANTLNHWAIFPATFLSLRQSLLTENLGFAN